MLLSSEQQGFYFDFWPFECRVFPVNIWFKFLAPGVSKDEAILSQVGDVERYSSLFISLADQEVGNMSDGTVLICCAIDIKYWPGDCEFLGSQAKPCDCFMVDKTFCCSGV